MFPRIGSQSLKVEAWEPGVTAGVQVVVFLHSLQSVRKCVGQDFF